jgi:hypothetical protein
MYFLNKHGYFLQTDLAVDESKLDEVTLIHSEDEAQEKFKDHNDCGDEDYVFIPSIIEKNGKVFAEDLNTLFTELEDGETIESYISAYVV